MSIKSVPIRQLPWLRLFSCGAAAVTIHGFCALDYLLSGKSVVTQIVATPIDNSMGSEISLSSQAFIAEYIALDRNESNNSTSPAIEILPKTIGKRMEVLA